MSQIETVQETAAANGWTVIDATDGSRTYGFTKDGRHLTAWFGPKGNLSGTQWTKISEITGRTQWVTPTDPRPFALVLAELTR